MPRGCLAAILACTALIYSRELRNSFVFDQAETIANNHYLNDWTFILKSLVSDDWWFRDPGHLPQSAYYRPLSSIWLWINFHLFGANPAGWHAAAILLHLIVVWLTYRVAAILSEDWLIGLLAAALYGLTPIHAEAVAWAFGAQLSAALELGAFEFYLYVFQSGERSLPLAGDDRSQWWRLVSLALCGGALLSYEGALIFPALIAAHAFIFARQRVTNTSGRKSAISDTPLSDRLRFAIVAAWPYAAEAAAYLVIRMLVLGFATQGSFNNELTVAESILTVPSAITAYLMLLLVPWTAAPAHLLARVDSIASTNFYVPLLAIGGVVGAVYVAIRHAALRDLYLYCGAWILIGLAPTLNLHGLPAGSLIQDRYLYLPSFGFCVIAAGMIVTVAHRNSTAAIAMAIGSAGIAATYAASLYSVQRFWHDDFTLFSKCVAEAPEVAVWHNHLGAALGERGDYPSARTEFQRAISLDASDGHSMYNLGLADGHLGDAHAAEREISDGIKLLGHAPAEAYADLAVVADAAGDTQGAEGALMQANAIPGGANIATRVRAQILFMHGDSKGAENGLHELLGRAPNDAQALSALATILSAEHRYDEALDAFRRVEELAPNQAGIHYRIAMALHNLGRDREAHDECALAIAAAPDNRVARALMAAIEERGAPH